MPRPQTKQLIAAVVVACVAAAAASMALFHFIELPAGWCLLAWCAPAAVIAVAGHGAARKLALSLCALLIALAAAEFILQAMDARDHRATSIRLEGTYLDYFRHRDPVLGYAPMPGKATAAKFIGTTEIYRVEYTIGPDGLRITPPAPPEAPVVMFFGCSFVFGEGLNDSETLPWQVAEACGHSFKTRNFGFHGYGAHQMLSAIESGWAGRAAPDPVRAAIYVGLLAHVPRVAGKSSWDLDGPRYILDEAGEPVRRGCFDSGWRRILRISAAMRRAAGRSRLFRRFAEQDHTPTPEDIRLYVAVVGKARRAFLNAHPNAEFHVIFWDRAPWNEDSSVASALADAIEKEGVPVHRMSGILPDIAVNPLRYAIHPSDPHPNALANRILAEYVAREILGCGRR